MKPLEVDRLAEGVIVIPNFASMSSNCMIFQRRPACHYPGVGVYYRPAFGLQVEEGGGQHTLAQHVYIWGCREQTIRLHAVDHSKPAEQITPDQTC